MILASRILNGQVSRTHPLHLSRGLLCHVDQKQTATFTSSSLIVLTRPTQEPYTQTALERLPGSQLGSEVRVPCLRPCCEGGSTTNIFVVIFGML